MLFRSGIDWRGQGGYVVAPPSLHSSGKRYEWEPGYGPDEHPFAELPAELVSLFSTTPAPSKLGASPSHGEIDITAYAIGMVRLQVGERNNMMARIAGHLLGINTPKPAALATLWAIAQQAETDDQHPPVTLQEVQATLDSIARSESRKRAAQAEIEDATLPDRLETFPAGDVLELARAALGIAAALLRPGGLTRAAIEAVLGLPLAGAAMPATRNASSASTSGSRPSTRAANWKPRRRAWLGVWVAAVGGSLDDWPDTAMSFRLDSETGRTGRMIYAGTNGELLQLGWSAERGRATKLRDVAECCHAPQARAFRPWVVTRLRDLPRGDAGLELLASA